MDSKILGVTLPAGEAWGLIGMPAPVLLRGGGLLAEYLAIHDGAQIIAVAKYLGRTADRSGWWLQDVVALRSPVVCRPGEGQWTLPADVLACVREEYAAARRFTGDSWRERQRDKEDHR